MIESSNFGPLPGQIGFWHDFEPWCRELHRHLSLPEVAAVVAQDGRTLIGCERISVVTFSPTRCRVVAISGQDQVNPRSPVVRALGDLCWKLRYSREPIVVHADSLESVTADLLGVFADYIQVSHGRILLAIPLLSPVRDSATLGDQERPSPRSASFGVMVCEQIQTGELSEQTQTRATLIAAHAAGALFIAWELKKIPLLGTLRAVGRTTQSWFEGRLGRYGIWAGLIGLLALALGIIPCEYRIACQGAYIPVERSQLFAPWDGEVTDVVVEDGQQVQPGQLLLTLRSEEFESRLLRLQTTREETLKQLLARTSQQSRAAGEGRTEEAIRLQGEIKELQIEADGLKQEVELLIQRLERRYVKAPLRGVVATFQLRQLLLDRPVRRGERLLEVMNVDGGWELLLEVPEDRAGHLLQAQQRLGKRELAVEFVLSTAVERTYLAEVRDISPRTELSDASSSVLLVRATPTGVATRDQHIGATVTARIRCGKASLAYVVFGDLWEFLRRQLWV